MPPCCTGICIQKVILEIHKLRGMFLVAVRQQVKIGAEMSKIKIRIPQAHLIKIEYL